MKKVFKIIGIIVIVIVVLVGSVFGFKKIRQTNMNNERRNAKTLMEYIRTHSADYLMCNSSECPSMYFEENKFICDIDYNNIKDFQSDYFVTKDNEIYDISFNELYSNNQNCKKREIDINIKNIQDYYIFSKDNKVYNISSLEEARITDDIQIYSIDKDIKKIIESDYNNVDYTNSPKLPVIVFKNNNIYKQIYKIIKNYDGNGTNKLTLEDEKIHKSLEEYGNIKYISFGGSFYTYSGKYYQLEDNTITTIISDKGYYYLDEVKTDECTKYKDIECKLELKESEIYKRFSKDIKFIGGGNTILSDNSVIRTGYLIYPLDKDLK